MEALFVFLKEILSSQPFLQVFVGGATFLLIAYMVTRAKQDKEELPPPAHGTLADIPPIFAQGPRETLDYMREIRDCVRSSSEYLSRIAECARITREQAVRHTELLERIEREQAIENRSHTDRREGR
ncbi:hypothetical protein J2X36_002159 [Methylobacterium sp. BE186]|uniref:hypothetical protein n=1 Tax=Methylobacterium sp. BE186 TaxID=2817715 RepID=UPI00285BCA79|nr:hypothetical protein [Methylobacterium sp. BE186]MDR7037412.1 hypothetical protein [Methylobacterium sp. BE186]